MSKKNETIIIRLDSDTKEAFRSLCELKSVSMTDIILNQINNILLESELKSSSSNFSTIIKERNFYKKEVELYKQTFSNINKTLLSINRKNSMKQDELYSEMFLENFSKIKQFNNYELIKFDYKNSSPDFIAVSKVINRKLLIDFRTGSLDDILIGPKSKYYYQMCKNLKDNKDLELVIISLDPEYCDAENKIEKLSKKIGYDITVYSFDEIFDFLYKN